MQDCFKLAFFLIEVYLCLKVQAFLRMCGAPVKPPCHMADGLRLLSRSDMHVMEMQYFMLSYSYLFPQTNG